MITTLIFEIHLFNIHLKIIILERTIMPLHRILYMISFDVDFIPRIQEIIVRTMHLHHQPTRLDVSLRIKAKTTSIFAC